MKIVLRNVVVTMKDMKQENERARKQSRERELTLERENRLLENRIRELTKATRNQSRRITQRWAHQCRAC